MEKFFIMFEFNLASMEYWTRQVKISKLYYSLIVYDFNSMQCTFSFGRCLHIGSTWVLKKAVWEIIRRNFYAVKSYIRQNMQSAIFPYLEKSYGETFLRQISLTAKCLKGEFSLRWYFPRQNILQRKFLPQNFRSRQKRQVILLTNFFFV